MGPKTKVNEEREKTNDNGRVSGKTVSGYDDGSAHISTYVNIPGVGSLTSSYDIDSDGNASGQHMHD